MVAGPHSVRAALSGDCRVHTVFLDESPPSRISSLAEVAREAGAAVASVPRGECDRLAGIRSQGVAAEITFKYTEFKAMLHAVDESVAGSDLMVFVDEVSDPHNLGAIVRTAAAVGARAVVIPGRRGAPINSTVMRVSAGGALHVPVCRVANLSRAISMAQKAGYWVYGLESRGAKSLGVDALQPRVGVVVGSEGAGLRSLVARTCDELVSLPMRNSVESLNASVAAGVAMYLLAKGLIIGAEAVDSSKSR